MLADGKVDVTPLITGTVGLGGVENASAPRRPEAREGYLINPKSDATSPRGIDHGLIGFGRLDKPP